MKLKTLLSFVFIFISAYLFSQQTTTISGTIVDEKKQPLIGASIAVKGTSIGTTTNEDGKYTLNVPNDAKTLVVSYIGYENKEMPFTPGQSVLNIDMAVSNISLNQVVVSVSRRKEKLLDAPASISVIGQEEMERNVVTTPVDELKTVAGVDIIRTGLVSSDVVVRGFNNIFSGSVLNVIDNRIGAVPSLKVNAYQLVSTIDLDYDKIEVVRGPASALYGPNASSGVISIMTKSPLEQEKKFETTISMMSGFTVLSKSYEKYNSGNPLSGNILNPELRHSGKLLNGKFGYKISASYFQGKDYPNYDPNEPYTGDSLLFGTAKNGRIFQPDTLGFTVKYDSIKHKNDTSARLDIRRFNKDFFVRKYTADARIDIKPTKDITITINGGLSSSHNIELTGLGAGLAGGDNGGWLYWYFQTRFKWKNLFVQYYIDASNSGSTYLIPQENAGQRQAYGSTGPPTPYNVQLLIDRSVMHVFQIQHSWAPVKKLNFVYGIDVQLTRPNTEGTIDGRFEPIAKLNQAGGYIQGDYDPLKWLKIVAAMRVDYNSIIQNVAVSPRAALVFKVAENQNIRLTYNRAFDSPNTLNQFLDLSNGLIPNGINVRGMGNPYGWNYHFDSAGLAQFKTAPWGGSYNSGAWISYNDNSANARMFDSLTHYLSKAIPQGLLSALFDGISGPGGTVANASHQLVNYANFATTGNLPGSMQNINQFQNLKRINNQYTQTTEIGYKGLLFHKLALQIDGYWTHISNYVSPLKSASGAVMLNANSYLGPNDPSGKLYQNLYANDSLLNKLLAPALDGKASLQNSSITPSLPGTIWDELVVLSYQFPIGTVTPNDPKYIGSDYILTYQNLGSLDIFGIDLSFQYNAFETNLHSINVGGSMSWVDKNQLILPSGDTVPLNAPKVKAAVTFDHRLKKSGFGYGLTFRYQMGYYGNSAIYFGEVKPAYLLDLRVSYKPKFYKGLLLSINVNNAANYQWSAFPGTPLMGSQFYAKAQVTF